MLKYCKKCRIVVKGRWDYCEPCMDAEREAQRTADPEMGAE
jgi:hypothetical protein